jgi:sporulation protein YlmC with PRC-barrel domain
MKERQMLKKLFLLSTVASLAAFPALAQEAAEPTTITPPAEQTAPAQPADQAPAPDMTQQDPAAEPATDPAVPEADMTQQDPAAEPATDPAVPETDMTQQDPAAEPTTDPAAPVTAEGEQPATPPPSEAVIPAQAADQVRAERMIGMDVFDTNGDKVGTVKDILFGKDGTASGIVLSVGGLLGVGAKQVGLQWSEVDIQPDAEVAKVQYNKDQLEAAPDFKTQEAQKAEADAAEMQMQQENAPAAAPTQ